jgi:DNA polymerase-3 subunit beta
MARLSGRELSACDLDLQISVTLPAILSDGAACLPVAPLLALVRRLPAEQDLHITSDGKTTDIVFGTSSYRLAALNAEDFPGLPMSGVSAATQVDGDALKKAIGFALPYVSTEETRYYLNGVFFDGDQAVATDGHRLASYPFGFDAGVMSGAILPTPASRALLKLPPVRNVVANEGRTRLRFAMDGVTMTARLIDGKYPEWRRVVPSNAIKARFKVGRADMLELLRRMRAVIRTGDGDMFMAWRGETMALAAIGRYDDVTVREILSIADLDGEAGALGFNIRYMADALSLLRGLDVGFSYSDPASPIILKSDGGGMLVQMPRRDDNELNAICTKMLNDVAPPESEAAA